MCSVASPLGRHGLLIVKTLTNVLQLLYTVRLWTLAYLYYMLFAIISINVLNIKFSFFLEM